MVRLPPALQPLRNATYRALWTAYVVVAVGAWMQNTGAGWLMTNLDPSPLMVSLVQAATIMPVFLLALPAGALADIVDRRRFLVGVQCMMLVSAAALAALTYAQLTDAPLLLLFTFLIGVGTALNGPAWGSVVMEVVPRADLPQAIALNGVGYNLARALGPALAGIVLAIGGSAMTFSINALSFLAVVGVVLSWHPRRTLRKLPPEHFLGAMRAGVRYVRNTPAVRAAMWRVTAYYLPTAGPWAMLPLVVREQLHLGPNSYGLLLGAMGIGGVTSGLLLPALRGKISRGKTVLGCSLLSCGGMGMLSVAHGFWLAALSMLLFGLGWVAASSTTQAAAQLAAPSWVRARSLAIYQLASNGSLVIGSFFWGWLGTRIGVSATLTAAAVVGILLAFVALVWNLDTAAPRASLPDGVPLARRPAPEAPAPELATILGSARGRVLELAHYTVAREDQPSFLAAMAELRHVRGRCGAVLWQLYEDVAHPDGWLELWSMESWTDHLRESARLSPDDHAALARVDAFRSAEPEGRIRRYIAVAAQAKPLRNVR